MIAKLRPAVQYFAEGMEAKLKKHDADRGDQGWIGDSPKSLLLRLTEELQELISAVNEGDYRTIRSEAADVANFAMMVADVCSPFKCEGKLGWEEGVETEWVDCPGCPDCTPRDYPEKVADLYIDGMLHVVNGRVGAVLDDEIMYDLTRRYPLVYPFDRYEIIRHLRTKG